eukprot:gene8029-9433_t
MKIIPNEYEELISNYEVLSLLEHKRKIKGQTLLNDFLNNTVNYLKTTPAAKETLESARATRKVCQEYRLTKAETLQILNIAPSTEVEVHLIIEDCEDRLADPLDLLAAIKEHLGAATERQGKPAQEEEQEENQEEDGKEKEAVQEDEQEENQEDQEEIQE